MTFTKEHVHKKDQNFKGILKDNCCSEINKMNLHRM